MTAATAYCPNCGAPVQPVSGFCGNCGAKIAAVTAPPFQTPSSYPGALPRPQVSAGAYKAAIAVLLVIIILLGLGLYSTSSGHLFPFGTNRYNLTNPPDSQSLQPPSVPAAASNGPYTTIWNACGGQSRVCTMSPNGWREGGVPDTYDYFVTYTSNVSITVYFFTLGQFVQYTVCSGDLSCVSGAYAYLPAAASQNMATFRLAEGCGDYVAIYVSSAAGWMKPTVSIAQNAAPAPTGYCAQAGSG